MAESGKKVAGGMMWSAIERFAVQGVQFLLNLIIARILAPEDYGLLVMLTIFMAVAQTFVDSGFGNALIQKKNRSQTDYSTVFYFNIVVAVVCYAVLYLSAPAIAGFYGEPQLAAIARWLGVNLILSALSVVQRSKLTIEMNFKTQAKASLAAVIISGLIGFVMAYTGFGVWALVVQNIANTLLSSALLWIYARWRPSGVFSWESFRTLFSFGSKLLASGLLHTIYVNMYSLVIGKVYRSAEAGIYNRAYSLAQFPSTNITSILTRVVYPMQCEMQDDPARLKASFDSYIRLSAFVVFPLMTLLAVLAKPLILAVLTEKWLPSAQLLTILSLGYMIYPILVLNNNILNVKGRSDYFLRAEIIKKVVSVAILCATIPFGVETLCWGLALYNVLDFVIIVHYSKKVIHTGYLSQIRDLLPVIALSSAMALVAWLTSSLVEQPVLQLIIGGASGMIFFVGAGWMLRMKEILVAVGWIKSKIAKSR